MQPLGRMPASRHRAAPGSRLRAHPLRGLAAPAATHPFRFRNSVPASLRECGPLRGYFEEGVLVGGGHGHRILKSSLKSKDKKQQGHYPATE